MSGICLRCSVFADLEMYLSTCTSICPLAKVFVHMQKYLYTCRSICPYAEVFIFAGLQKPSVCSVTKPTGLPDEAHLQTTVMINCIGHWTSPTIHYTTPTIHWTSPTIQWIMWRAGDDGSCEELAVVGGRACHFFEKHIWYQVLQFRTFYQSSHIVHTEVVAWNNGNHDGWALAGQQLSDSLKRRPVGSATDDLIHTYVGLSPNFPLDGRDCRHTSKATN